MFLIFLVYWQGADVLFLFDLIFLLRIVSLASKSFFVSKFACANLPLKFSDVSLLSFELVMYSS